jgi:AcrR family transcriptional regulator
MVAASTPSSKRLSAEERREQILDVTAEMLGQGGLHSVSIQSVARAAGVSRPIVYEHFGDLGGLLEALVKREMTRAGEQVSRSALEDLSHGEPTELILASLSAYLHAVEEHPSTWRLVLTPPEGAPELLRKSIVQGRASVLDGLREAVRPGLRRGERAEDPDMTARTLSAIADEYARLVLSDPQRFPPERLLTHARWFLGELTP